MAMHLKRPLPNPPINARLYYEAACRMGLSVHYEPELSYLRIDIGKHKYHLVGTVVPINDTHCFFICGDKYAANQILDAGGFPVARAIKITSHDYHANNWTLGDLNYPVVAKPTLLGYGGRDVLCNIKNKEVLIDFLDYCFEDYEVMTVEAFHGGLKSYRVMILEGKIIGLLERIPATVVGDGKHTLQQLIDLENNRRQSYVGNVSIDRLAINQEYRIRMAELGITAETVISKDDNVMLCYTSNALLGGTMQALDVSLICQENRKLLVDAADWLKVGVVGFDLACEDIGLPMIRAGSTDIIVEANNNPDITIHEKPLKGPRNMVTEKVLESLLRRHPVAYTKYKLKNLF